MTLHVYFVTEQIVIILWLALNPPPPSNQSINVTQLFLPRGPLIHSLSSHQFWVVHATYLPPTPL